MYVVISLSVRPIIAVIEGEACLLGLFYIELMFGGGGGGGALGGGGVGGGGGGGGGGSLRLGCNALEI